MKVHELIALLSACDPDGEVMMCLPMYMGEAKPDDGNKGLAFSEVPTVTPLWSTEAIDAKRLADRVYIELPDEWNQ